MTFDAHAHSGTNQGKGWKRPLWLGWVAEQGEMGARVASFDWAATPLGALSGWPAPVRSAVTLCLGSLFPMTLRLGDDRLVLYNDACREIFGPDRFSSALGRPSREVWPETSAQLGAILDEVIGTRRPFFDTDRLVYLNRAVPGEECYFTFSYIPIVGDGDETWGVLSVFVETTPAILSQRRLASIARLGRETRGVRSERELARVAMEVLAQNPGDHPAGALYPAPRPGAEVTEPLARFGEPIDCGRGARLVERCLTQGTAQHDDGAGAGRLHAFPVLDPERDAPTHVLVIAHHRARPWEAGLAGYLALLASSLGSALLTQAELWTERRRVARAEALDAAKSAFFAGVSHELRTPLSLIAAPIDELLDRGAEFEPSVRHDLVLVRSSVSRLARLVDAMLDFSRMEAGRVVPHLALSNLAVIVGGLAASFAPAMERAGLDFVVEVGDVDRPALVDRDFLERIVLNLLSNAIKYTAEGSVTLRLVAAGEAYEIVVTDTGPGIDPDDQLRVFDRFERLTPPPGARHASGAGIGLAMVRQLTELLSGTVSLDSAPGRGSTFTVRLPFEPRLPAGRAGQSITPRRAESFLAEFDTGTPAVHESAAAPDAARLLVVEDDGALAGFLVESLSKAYRVEVAADGEAGLAAIRRERPDIVLSDLSMPGMDGLALVAAIRADPALRGLPVLLLTARANDDAAATGLGEGADDYIAKPFTMTDLRARLAANLARARERNLDAAWRQATLAAIQDGVVIFDSEGLVVELNQGFTELLGYSTDDGPIRPPYPWWPTPAEDAEALAAISAAHAQARRGQESSRESLYYRRDRRPVWVLVTDAAIRDGGQGLAATVRTVRDISREKAARERRAAAAQVTGDFSAADDLDTLLAVAEQGFAMLFEGGSTVQLSVDGEHQVVIGGGLVTPDDLPEQVRTGLAGEPSPDTTSRRPGILLVPRSSESGCRAWIQFPRPRRIGPDEMIVADLLAQAFALAVDRVFRAQKAADRETNLRVAVESHRLIGQAIGILVERHHILPAQAFEQLKIASQNRNLKLREVARRVIETGQEPSDA